MINREKLAVRGLLLLSSLLLILFMVGLDRFFFSGQLAQGSLQTATLEAEERERSLQDFFRKAQAEMLALRQNALFQEFLQQQDIERLFPLAQAIARANPQLMQVRYIDHQGQELLRIDRPWLGASSYRVAEAALQNKSHRDYFQSPNNRLFEQVWFSAIDLNQERGEIEVPNRPTVRAVFPVARQGEFQGLLVLNYFMADFLDNFIASALFDVVLLDRELQVLVHPDHAYRWSRQRPEAVDIRTRFPGLETAIQRKEWMNSQFYLRQLNLPVDALYVLFSVREAYLTDQQAVQTDRHWALALASMALAGVLSILLGNHLEKLVGERDEGAELARLLVEKNEVLERLSTTDSLTGLLNRREFDRQINATLNSARRTNRRVNLALFDLDDFKQYNDHYGHQAGDRALKAIGRLLNEKLKRTDDLAFRVGGEEFALLTQGTDREEVVDFVEGLRRAILRLKIPHEKSAADKVMSASFGLMTLAADDIESSDWLYREVDRLLYQAKAQGKNQVQVNAAT